MKHTTSYPNDTPLIVQMIRRLGIAGSIHDKINDRAHYRRHHEYWYGGDTPKARSEPVFSKQYYMILLNKKFPNRTSLTESQHSYL